MSCDSSNLVYLIDCAKCKKSQYVGETGQPLKKRFYGHRHNIKHYKNHTDSASAYTQEDTMAAKHFNLAGHAVAHMQCTAIEKINADDICWRKRRERFWRHQLQTNFPDGLNVFD